MNDQADWGQTTCKSAAVCFLCNRDMPHRKRNSEGRLCIVLRSHWTGAPEAPGAVKLRNGTESVLQPGCLYIVSFKPSTSIWPSRSVSKAFMLNSEAVLGTCTSWSNVLIDFLRGSISTFQSLNLPYNLTLIFEKLETCGALILKERDPRIYLRSMRQFSEEWDTILSSVWDCACLSLSNS